MSRSRKKRPSCAAARESAGRKSKLKKKKNGGRRHLKSNGLKKIDGKKTTFSNRLIQSIIGTALRVRRTTK